MLGKADATPMIAVRDLDRARKFYEDKLGLETKDEWGGEGATLKSGDTLINVYRSEFAGTNKATALNFDVDDIDNFCGFFPLVSCTCRTMIFVFINVLPLLLFILFLRL